VGTLCDLYGNGLESVLTHLLEEARLEFHIGQEDDCAVASSGTGGLGSTSQSLGLSLDSLEGWTEIVDARCLRHLAEKCANFSEDSNRIFMNGIQQLFTSTNEILPVGPAEIFLHSRPGLGALTRPPRVGSLGSSAISLAGSESFPLRCWRQYRLLIRCPGPPCGWSEHLGGDGLLRCMRPRRLPQSLQSQPWCW
jgi:hypothetical protein